MGTVELTGLLMMARWALGQCLAQAVARSRTIEALVCERASEWAGKCDQLVGWGDTCRQRTHVEELCIRTDDREKAASACIRRVIACICDESFGRPRLACMRSWPRPSPDSQPVDVVFGLSVARHFRVKQARILPAVGSSLRLHESQQRLDCTT